MAETTVLNVVLLISFIMLVSIVLFVKRKKIKKLREKYKNLWRDILRIFTISVSYTQINSSLPSLIQVRWPGSYLVFLEEFDWVNVDVFGLFGFGCVGKMDYRLRALMASCVPIFVVALSVVLHMCRKRPNETDKVTRMKAALHIFDAVDTHQDGVLESFEFIKVLHQMGQKNTTETHAIAIMNTFGAKEELDPRGKPILTLSRENFVNAAVNDDTGKSLGTHWVAKAEGQHAMTERLANVLLILFLIHAPVSQRMFLYFAYDPLGTGPNKREFLQVDYSIERHSDKWFSFVPFIVLILLVFTFGVPMVVLFLLCRNRKHLHEPMVKQMLGFLYSRFHIGSEMWEIHEVFRKMALTGLLIFLPPESRNVAAILICVVCCCSLHFYQPHRNRVVLFISQMSFLMSTFKYLVAVVIFRGSTTRDDVINTTAINATAVNPTGDEDEDILGILLVCLDVIFMCSSGIAIVAVIILLRRSLNKIKKLVDNGVVSKGPTEGFAGNVKVHPAALGSESKPENAELKLQQLMEKEKQQEQEMTDHMNKSMTHQHDRLALRLERKKSQQLQKIHKKHQGEEVDVVKVEEKLESNEIKAQKPEQNK